MNFQDLYRKIQAIDEGSQMAPPSVPAIECGDMPPSDRLLVGDQGMEECGMSMMPPSASKQTDSVSMNVSMNGSGAGGIRDLMSILRNIEQAAPGGHGDDAKDVVVGMANGADMLELTAEESFANPVETDTWGVDDVVNPPSNDLAANNGDHRVRQHGLPRAQMESLVDKLANQYQSIKESDPKSHQAKTTLKHLKKASYGDRADAANIKPGVKGYRDRVAMLQRAKDEGNLKDD
jgi:hypothetical protein